MQALNSNSATAGAWDAIHALSYHTYVTDLDSIISETTSLYQQFGKPIWITEIASGGGSSMAQNVALMEAFVPWANSQSWIERYFWNQAVSLLSSLPMLASPSSRSITCDHLLTTFTVDPVVCLC